MAEADRANKDNRFTAVIIGECGMGKSTVVYNLAGRPQLDVSLDGTNPDGVTKKFTPYKANLRGLNKCYDKIIDTSGIGDQTVGLIEWVSMAEKTFEEVNCILCCVSETNPRITLGADLVTKMINRGFLGDKDRAIGDAELTDLLCNAVVLVGTKGNMATKRMRKSMKATTANFAKKCGLPHVKYVAVDAGEWEEDSEDEDETPVLVLDALQQHLANLKGMIDDLEAKGKSQHTVMEYKQIKNTELVDMVCKSLNLEVTDEAKREMAQELDVWRNAVRSVTHLFSFDAEMREKGIGYLTKTKEGIVANVHFMFEEMKRKIYGEDNSIQQSTEKEK